MNLSNREDTIMEVEVINEKVKRHLSKIKLIRCLKITNKVAQRISLSS